MVPDTPVVREGGPTPSETSAEPSAAVRGSPEWVAAWKCCGCGILMPDLNRACDCPTGVVGRGGNGFHEQALKIDPPLPSLLEAIEDALTDSLGPGWTCRDGAGAVGRLLAEHGITALGRQ